MKTELQIKERIIAILLHMKDQSVPTTPRRQRNQEIIIGALNWVLEDK